MDFEQFWQEDKESVMQLLRDCNYSDIAVKLVCAQYWIKSREYQVDKKRYNKGPQAIEEP